MSRKLLNRCNEKWAHPESVEDGFWTTDAMMDPKDIKKMSSDEIEAMRESFREPLRSIIEDKDNPDYAGIDWKDYYKEGGCPEEQDAPAVHILVGIPKDLKAEEKAGAVFCITGGGLTGGGTAELGALSTRRLVVDSNQKVVHICFEYRIAPAHPYPAAVNDCHAVYMWVIEHAKELQIDVNRIVITGGSTGGQLALCTAFRLKRYNWCGAPMPRGLIIQVPVMDDIAFTNSYAVSYENEATEKIAGWDSSCCYTNFLLWLGERFADPTLPPEAVPNRAVLEDVQGFPPVWIPAEAEFEPGRDSIYQLTALLHEAGIFCDLHVWGGANHGFCGGGDSDFAKRFQMIAAGALRDALTYDFRRPWLKGGKKIE